MTHVANAFHHLDAAKFKFVVSAPFGHVLLLARAPAVYISIGKPVLNMPLENGYYFIALHPLVIAMVYIFVGKPVMNAICK